MKAGKITVSNYNVYIDEAGDEGFKFECDKGRGSSKFFVLSAIIVKQELDQKLASIVNEIKKILKYQQKDILAPLHFYKMSHEKKKVCVNQLEQFRDFTVISVVFQKEKLQEQLKVKSVLYNYACKLLLEKVTIYLKREKAKANFIFEHRRNTHYDELETYMRKVIDYGQYVLSIRSLTKSQSKCLQLADIVASSTYQAFEPNQYDGDVEPYYYMKLSNNIFIHNGKYLGYGLKLFPSDTDILEQEKYSWINEFLRKHSKELKTQ